MTGPTVVQLGEDFAGLTVKLHQVDDTGHWVGDVFDGEHLLHRRFFREYDLGNDFPTMLYRGVRVDYALREAFRMHVERTDL